MQSLRLFCDVAGHRSFSEAARKHGITQSAASQRVGQMEKRLGVTLFDRSVRPLALTPAGELYLRECQELVERYDRLEARLGSLRPQPSGEVTVGAIYSAGIDLLNHVQEAFEQTQPQVRVSVEYKQHDAIYQAVRERQCDLGILSYPAHHRDLAVIPLRDEVMAVVCAPEHPLARRQTVQAGELGAWEMVGFEPWLPVAKRIRRYLKDHSVEPRIDKVFDNVDTIKGAVAMTGELAILPRRTVLREAAAGTLAVVALEPQLLRPLGIVCRKKNGLKPAAQAFVDFLLEHAGPQSDLLEKLEARSRQMVGGSV
ncbi:MAG: LysR family transcriptional regulator [Phycisphaeraceae bacterium]|nr:LysR family transcriptional regulator [Phycisphaeraceae bacterium]